MRFTEWRSAAQFPALFLIAMAAPALLDAQVRQAESFEWQGRIASGGTLEIKGVNGPVSAVPASGTTARVRASRTGRRSDPAEVEIAVVEHAGGVTICAVYPSRGLRRNECRPGSEGRIGALNNDVQVSFIVEVPATADFVAQSTNGPVTAENLAGSVTGHTTNGDIRIQGGSRAFARTTNGSVTIRTSGEAVARTTNGKIVAHIGDLSGHTPLSFSTTNGSITLGIPDGASATIDAGTTNGRIHTDFPITMQGSLSRTRLAGTIGEGGRTIQLRTTNGGIRIERTS
jgi:hypothetical protein